MGSTLVYDGDAVPEELREWAARRGVNLVSLVKFQGGYDLRPYATRLADRLAADERYPPELYVPQRFTVLEGQRRGRHRGPDTQGHPGPPGHARPPA